MNSPFSTPSGRIPIAVPATVSSPATIQAPTTALAEAPFPQRFLRLVLGIGAATAAHSLRRRAGATASYRFPEVVQAVRAAFIAIEWPHCWQKVRRRQQLLTPHAVQRPDISSSHLRWYCLDRAPRIITRICRGRGGPEANIPVGCRRPSVIVCLRPFRAERLPSSIFPCEMNQYAMPILPSGQRPRDRLTRR